MSKRRRGNDVRDDRVMVSKKQRQQSEQEQEFGQFQMCPREVLERIFGAGKEKLSAEELFHYGNMCTAFVGPVQYVYGKMYKRMNAYCRICSSLSDVKQIGNDVMRIHGYENSHRYIELFHAHMSRLEVKYGGDLRSDRNLSAAECARFNQFVQGYCAETLEYFSIEDLPENTTNNRMFDISKPFIRVATLSITRSNLSNQFPLFPELFPIINHLELLGNTTATNFSVRFARLTELILESQIDFLQYAPLLSANPHIRNLTIDTRTHATVGFPKITKLLKNNPGIEELIVNLGKTQANVTRHQIVQFIKAHQALRILRVESHRFQVDDIIHVLQFTAGSNSRLIKFYCCVANQDNKVELIARVRSLAGLNWFTARSADSIVKCVRPTWKFKSINDWKNVVIMNTNVIFFSKKINKINEDVNEKIDKNLNFSPNPTYFCKCHL